MASITYSIFRWSPGPDTRLTMALLASALLHALILMSLSKHLYHASFFSRSGNIALSVRIDRLPEKHDVPVAAPIVVKEKRSVFRRQPTASAPVVVTAPVHVERSLPQPGVAVSETLFLRPVPARVVNALLADGEYRPAAELSAPPSAVAISVPTYPRPASEKKKSGWVVVLLFVDEQGRVVDTVPVESSESFDEYKNDIAAELRDSIFTPGKLDGRDTKARVFIMVKFDGNALSATDVAKDLVSPVPADSQPAR